MKPVRLEVRGFTAFRDSAVVDFDDRQLFVITGPTGAGKSSLLDAIIWALFGQVPRVGTATRQLVTHGEKSMAVRFDFTAHGGRYRVSRHAPGSVGARLELLSDAGKWVPLADRSREVTAQVTQLLGLDYQTFTRTIVLPQGAFDAFLRGDERDRRAILTRLLGLDTYEEAGRAARSRARSAHEIGGNLRQQLERLTLATPDTLAALERERDQLDARLAGIEERRERLTAVAELARAAAEAHRSLDVAHEAESAAVSALRDAEQAVAEAEQELDATERRRSHVDEEARRLGYHAESHERLRVLVSLVERRDEASGAAEEASATLDQAEAATERTRAVADERRAGAAAASETLAAASAALSAIAGRARECERRLDAEAAAAEQARAHAEQEAVEQEQRAQTLETLARQVETLAGEHSVVERAATQARSAEDDTADALAAATAALEQAEALASARREALDEARVHGAADALRRDLKLGDPCPVCGEPIEQLPMPAASNLDQAVEAAAEAERALDGARAERERRVALAAKATATVEHAERALAGVLQRRSALDGELVEAGVERGEVPTSVERARQGATFARSRAAEQQQSAAEARRAERGLSLLLATVPDLPESPDGGGTSAEVVTGDGEDDSVATVLRDTLGHHVAVASASQSSAQSAREAGEELRVVQAAAERARAEQGRAAKDLAAAEQRLASVAPDGDSGAEQARRQLEEMDGRAARARELEHALREAEAHRAASAARRDERRNDCARAQESALRRGAETAAAEERERTAATALAHIWSDVAGAELIGAEAAEQEMPGAQKLAEMLATIEREGQDASQALGAVRERLDRARLEAEEAARMREQVAELERAAAVAGALEQELHGDRFIAYIQREALQMLATDASLRLLQLTNDRYRLAIDGNEFMVIDRLNGEERRSVKTLSGGETFLASLALSLALSERLPELAGTGGAVSLESLFIDEGFGSLDSQSLDVAIEGLETLVGRAGEGRMVGVISHVPELAERLQDRVEVVKTDRTSLVLN